MKGLEIAGAVVKVSNILSGLEDYCWLHQPAWFKPFQLQIYLCPVSLIFLITKMLNTQLAYCLEIFIFMLV